MKKLPLEINKVLIIAPHPDDEINIGGQLIIECVKKKISVYVLYTTNGDNNTKIGNKRLKEAIDSLEVLGVPEEHVIFLGYSNDWTNGKHIYDKGCGEILQSKSGCVETSAIDEHMEYIFKKEGIHHSYTRDNFKLDFKNAIGDLLPELIIAVDMDTHPDHRAASLMLEEVIGELLKEKSDFRPLILKKFAYSGVWKGPKDYYTRPMAPTVNTIGSVYNDLVFETGSPFFKWDDRLSFMVPEETVTPLLSQNVIYQAAKMHKTQVAWYQMLRAINGDVVYWWRPTNNVFTNAKINVSSGEISYLTDFKYFEISKMVQGLDEISKSTYAWTPCKEDMEKTISIELKERTDIETLVIIGDYNPSNCITEIAVSCDGQRKVYRNEHKDIKWQIQLNAHRVNTVLIEILGHEGIPAIAELEAYEHSLKFESMYVFPLRFYENNKRQHNKKKTILQWLEYLYLNLLFLIRFKIKYEVKNLMGVNK